MTETKHKQTIEMDKARKKQLKKEYKIKMSQKYDEKPTLFENWKMSFKTRIIFYMLFCFSVVFSIVLSIQSNKNNYYKDNYSNFKNDTQIIESSNNYKSTFTNVYGTETTICNHSGCTNYIASSGDTNCCVKHSNKCLNCRKYIDEDAMYCMACLINAIEKIK